MRHRPITDNLGTLADNDNNAEYNVYDAVVIWYRGLAIARV